MPSHPQAREYTNLIHTKIGKTWAHLQTQLSQGKKNK